MPVAIRSTVRPLLSRDGIQKSARREKATCADGIRLWCGYDVNDAAFCLCLDFIK